MAEHALFVLKTSGAEFYFFTHRYQVTVALLIVQSMKPLGMVDLGYLRASSIPVCLLDVTDERPAKQCTKSVNIFLLFAQLTLE